MHTQVYETLILLNGLLCVVLNNTDRERGRKGGGREGEREEGGWVEKVRYLKQRGAWSRMDFPGLPVLILTAGCGAIRYYGDYREHESHEAQGHDGDEVLPKWLQVHTGVHQAVKGPEVLPHFVSVQR